MRLLAISAYLGFGVVMARIDAGGCRRRTAGYRNGWRRSKSVAEGVVDAEEEAAMAGV